MIGKPVARVVASLLVVVFATGALAKDESACSISSLSGAGLERPSLFDTSGDAVLDRALVQELSWLSAQFKVKPRFFLFDDGDAPNAYSTPECVPGVPRFTFPDGTVAFGAHLMQQQFRETFGQGYSIPAIMAHEFTHTVQACRKSTLRNKARELHADFMAGWYIANRSGFVPTDARQALAAFYKLGDYAFNSPQHHGTPDERLASAIQGFNCAGQSLDEAYTSGEDLVSRRPGGGGRQSRGTNPAGATPAHGRWVDAPEHDELEVEFDDADWGNKRSGDVTAVYVVRNSSEETRYRVKVSASVVRKDRDTEDVLGTVDRKSETVDAAPGKSVKVRIHLRWATDRWNPNEDEMPAIGDPDVAVQQFVPPDSAKQETTLGDDNSGSESGTVMAGAVSAVLEAVSDGFQSARGTKLDSDKKVVVYATELRFPDATYVHVVVPRDEDTAPYLVCRMPDLDSKSSGVQAFRRLADRVKEALPSSWIAGDPDRGDDLMVREFVNEDGARSVRVRLTPHAENFELRIVFR